MSKVIFKLTFKHPNFKDTKQKNVAHIDYIAKRSGVDKTLTAVDLEKELRRDVEKIINENEVYINYIHERPKSHGLFDQNGVADPEQVKKELSQHDSFVWRAIVSLREEDAKELGYLSKEKWQDLLRNKVPDMAKEMGIKINNIRWAGAVHMAKGHPHAHIVFWEAIPERTIGVVSKKVIVNIKKHFTDEIFKEEKFWLMNEKTAIRDLIRDLAKDNVGQAARLLMEVRESGLDIKALMQEENKEGICPQIQKRTEIELIEKIKKLAEIIPGRGRASLKFMPEDVKEEVRKISDFLLSTEQYSLYLEKYLKVVVENNKLYTSQDDDLNKTRENAYNDIRDRVCQIILRAALESQHENVFYIDKKLAEKSVEKIREINDKIDLQFEYEDVFKKLASSLLNSGLSANEVAYCLFSFSSRENLFLKMNHIKDIIKSVENEIRSDGNIGFYYSSKSIGFGLAALKAAGFTENDAFELQKAAIKRDIGSLNDRFNYLVNEGIFKIQNEKYCLTQKGINEFLKVKKLDDGQKAILSFLEKGPADLSFILENKNILRNLFDKNPDEFKLGRFDLRIFEEFGEDNSITLKELEQKIYKKYTMRDVADVERAEKEFDIYKLRIEKLCLNGYVELNKETGKLSFTPEALNELNNVPYGMEFTRYDANITLSYIDKAENGILSRDELKKIIYDETVNLTARSYCEKFSEMLESGQLATFISCDKDGNITATKEGKILGYEFRNVNNIFREAKDGNLSEEKIMHVCRKLYGLDAEEYFTDTMQQIEKFVEKKWVLKNVDNTYSVDPYINDVNIFLYYLYKAGGCVHKDNLFDVLNKNIPNKEAANQYKYLVKRLENLKYEGYLAGDNGLYYLTELGREKRFDLLYSERELLLKEIDYLTRLGLIDHTNDGYVVTSKYFKYMNDITSSKLNNVENKSFYINNELAGIIENFYGDIDTGKIERSNLRILRGIYINNSFQDIKTGYQALRDLCGVKDITKKTITNLTTTLLASGIDIEETRAILQNWNIRSGSNLDESRMNEIIDMSFKKYQESTNWGKVSLVSFKDWNDMFKVLGVKEVPNWMYKGENWKALMVRGVGLASIINDIWKSVWRQFERERMHSEAQAEYMKKNQIKQQAVQKSKAARREAAIKYQDRSSLAKEEHDL